MKKIIIFMFVFIAFQVQSYSQNQHRIEWLNQVSGLGKEIHHAHCTDNKGNIYITGISQSYELNFGNCQIIETDQFKSKLFIAKYDSNGVFKWVRIILTANPFYIYACHTDNNDNVYFTFTRTAMISQSETLDFGDSIKVDINNYLDFSVIVKYSPDGKALWARKFHGNGWCTTDFCFDEDNNLFAVGSANGGYNSLIDFGDNVILKGRQANQSFLVKYSSAGICQWAKTFKFKTDTAFGGITGAVKHYNKYIYLLGYTQDSTDFGDGIYHERTYGKGEYINFLASYSTEGEFKWVYTSYASLVNPFFHDLVINNKGDIYLNQQFSIYKFTQDGTLLWKREMLHDSGKVWSRQLIMGKEDNLFILGSIYPNSTITFWDSTKFNTGNYFILQIDKNDNLVDYFDVMYTNGYNMRNSAFAFDNHCSADKNGNVYDFGNYDSEKNLPGDFLFTPYSDDIFLLKYSAYATKKRGSQNYPKIDGFNNLVFRDAAKKMDTLVRLTPAREQSTGAVWTKQKINVRDGFNTEFSFRMSEGFNNFNEGSAPGADGIAFVIQNTDTFALGSNGGGIGFEDISNSLAVEFDSYNNFGLPYNDNDGSHIAVFSNGKQPNTPYHNTISDMSTTNKIPVLKADSTIYYARIEYNIEPGKLRIFFDTTNKFVNPIIELNNIYLDSLLKLSSGYNAYIGFTSATGTSLEIHDLLSWTLCSGPEKFLTDLINDEPIDNPESVLISPNPASDYIEISFPNVILSRANLSINIFDILGECIIKVEQTSQSVQRIDVSHLAPGEYFVWVGGIVKKFIKI